MINILTLDKLILSRFAEDQAEVDKKVLSINKYFKSLDDEVEMIDQPSSLKKLFSSYLVSESIMHKEFYIAETLPLLKEYSEILKLPLVHTVRPTRQCQLSLRKELIEREFIAIVNDLILQKGWMDIDLVYRNKLYDDKYSSMINTATTGINDATHTNESGSRSSPVSSSNSRGSTTITCYTCKNTDINKFETDEANKKTCLICSTQLNTIETGHTHQDYTRVNIVGKFVYNRVMHFRDCIRQFQGKQNCKIPEQLFKDLTAKFEAYRLLVKSDNYHIRYSKINPQHILMFLKELKYAKHYENVNVIYYTLTNKRVADIGDLEDKLIEDFKELVTLYDNLHSKDKPKQLDRKNFMNVHYLLYQLLRKNGYNCKLSDFSILKTTDRKLFHDNICSNLFEKLGWNFTPTF